MEKSSLAEIWRVLSERAFADIEIWRKDHPQATFQEIEEELDAHLSGLRAQMLSDVAQRSAKRDWGEQDAEKRPQCPECGAVLQMRGEHERCLRTQGDQEVKLTRQYGACPQCGSGFFPPR